MNKHRFKRNTLTFALLTLGCGYSMYSIAQNTTDTTQQVAKSEQYAGQAFFERYYVKHSDENSAIRSAMQNARTRYCEGSWIAPITQGTKAPKDFAETTTTLEANYGYYNPTGDSELEGDVVIEQQGRKIRADKVILDPTQTYATVQGTVEMAQDGIVAQSDSVRYNLKQQTGDFENSYYISEQNQAHGRAGKIKRPNANSVVLENASYSTCAPSSAPTWRIEAKHIELNQETGRGITKGTKLYIKNTPVLAIPYFNFPIDDRRTTGLLNPTFGYTNDGGVQVSAPIYLNLAPNYDATITPRYLSERGLMLDGEFRYLTPRFGAGTMWGGFLPSDDKYNNEDRKDFHFLHYWNINPQWTTRAEYHYASDKDFFSDLSQNPNTSTDLNLRRAWELEYGNGIQGLTAKLKVEKFQTLDKSVLDEDKPYARLPQFSMNYLWGSPQGWQVDFHNNSTYFKKRINDSSTALEDSGVRLYNDLAIRYNWRKPFAYVIPEASIRHLYTWYDEDALASRNLTRGQGVYSVTVPQFTLNAGLNFEKQGKFLQSISPQLFYAYAPYKNQSSNPNFDTTTASINYDQLFNPSRFYGYDRLDDNNFVSLGVNYRLFSPNGLERLRAGIGQSFFFEDRRVTLSSDVATERRTGPIISLGSQFNENLSINANAGWTSSGQNAQRDIQLYYTGDKGNLYNVGYFYRQEIANRQLGYEQAMFSFIQPINEQWRMLGHAQYDLNNEVIRDSLLGVNYESCCWGVSVYGRSYYNDLDNPNDPEVSANRAIMAEFTLKGLGGLNNKLSSLLESRVLGFNKTNQFWTEGQ